MKNHCKKLTALSLLVVLGCSSISTDPRPAFDDVQENIARRSGQQIQWKRYRQEDDAVDTAIGEMLKQELDDDQVVQIALLNNPRIQAIYERLGVAQAQLVQAGLLKNPVFDMSLRFVEGSSNDYILEMGVAKDFLDILLISRRKNLAEYQLEMAKAEVTGAVIDLAAQARIAFYSYLGALQTYELNKELTKIAELYFDAATRLYDAGNITDLALARKRSIYEQTKLDLALSESRMLEYREILNTRMGLWGQQTGWKTIPTLPEAPEERMVLDELEQRAIDNSLDLIVARQQLTSAAVRAGIDTAELIFPDTVIGTEAERGQNGTWSAGPAFSVGVPIFDVGQARTAESHAHLQRLWKRYSGLAIDIRSAVRRQKHRFVNTRHQTDYYKQVIVPLSEQITFETQLQYNAMQLGIFDLLEAKKREVESRKNYIDALTQYWIARTELELLLNGHFVNQSPGSVSAGRQGFRPFSGY